MSTHTFDAPDPYAYHNGFPSYHESEAIPSSLPTARNSPQRHPLGLYTEKLSGSAFTSPRAHNRQTWLYRILPSAQHRAFTPSPPSSLTSDPLTFTQHPTQLRWSPFALPATPTTFPEGIHPLAGVGSAPLKDGLQISMYTCTASMPETQAFYSADGDMLLVPQLGALDIRTELGRLFVRPTEIAVIPRGIRFHIALPNGEGRGYILETFSAAHFELPELGPIGSNGLANARDFQVPRAAYIDDHGKGEYELLAKFDGRLFTARQGHTPFDVVAWQGNYYPMKYDLNRFNTIGSISYDHPDPSIFTVLTVPSAVPGTAIADFVVFPPRWLVAENTFRPPWFHRNCMSEFMGLIEGGYDGKTGGGFVAGGASLHNVMAGHGPDAATVERASAAELKPRWENSGIAFMFESCYMLGVSRKGLEGEERQMEYSEDSWGGVKRLFTGERLE